LKKLKSLGYTLAIASRTSATSEARELLKLFEWENHLSFLEIYPGKKTTHLNEISKSSSVPLSQMLFFDDEHRNITDTKRIGVCSVLVNNGINHNIVKEGIKHFIESNK